MVEGPPGTCCTGVSDRWAERRPLLQQQLKDIDADVFCFQEVLRCA